MQTLKSDKAASRLFARGSFVASSRIKKGATALVAQHVYLNIVLIESTSTWGSYCPL